MCFDDMVRGRVGGWGEVRVCGRECAWMGCLTVFRRRHHIIAMRIIRHMRVNRVGCKSGC